MPYQNGFELLDKVKDFSFEVIFTTAFHNYAIKAFKYNAANYLLKPINPQDLKDAVQRIEQRFASKDNSSVKTLLEKMQSAMQDEDKRIALHTSAKLVAEYFGFVNQPLVVSNACISGLLGIITAMRLIKSNQYENIIIAGADVITKFVFSGFQSFQALSNNICKPFDKNRDGINLGEGATTVILTCNKKTDADIKIVSGSVSNDANHISGPSRTGDELFQCIDRTMKDAKLNTSDIDFISAHGTATLYNDEMEAKAIASAKLESSPVNSLKGYYGHTLGAAGLIESIISIQSLKQGIVIPTKGFEEPGVSKAINICSEIIQAPLRHCLKTASGFGGCNAAVIFSK
jgi:3-oxoacyl-[acyl-carrier-protein] synthase-1